MTLTRLSLAQFRSWRRLDLDLDDRPVAIHGANGSGKTNILEALSMLAPGRGLRGVAATEQARRDVAAGWRIRAVIAGEPVETLAAPGERRTVSIDEQTVPQTALGRLLRIIWLVPAMDRLWSDPPEARRRFLDRITLSFIPEHAEDSLIYEKAMRERNRLFRDEVTDPGWYRALETQMAEAGARITRNRFAALDRIEAAQSARSSAFPSATLTLLAGEGFANDADPASIAERFTQMRSREIAAGRSLSGPHRADLGAHWGPQSIPAALSSTGEQKALLLSLILANARALADQRPVLLLDEVAAHLDADRRALLYDEIVEMPGQAFLTGTGAELFGEIAPRAQMIKVRQQDGVSALDAV